MTAQRYEEIRTRVLAAARAESPQTGRWDAAAGLLDRLVLGEFIDFLTLPGYELLIERDTRAADDSEVRELERKGRGRDEVAA